MASATEGGDNPAQTQARKVLTQEERDDLLVHHVAKLREQTQAVEKAREPLSAAQQELTARFNEAKADLGKGYSRKILSGYVTDSQARARDLVAEEKQRAHDKAVLGQPVFGVNAQGQFDMFAEHPTTPDEVKDEAMWEAEGFLLGRAGALEPIPEGAPPRFHQTILAAYEKGQQLTQERFLRGQALKAKQGQPDADAQPKDLNEPEPTTAEAKAAERKSVRKARESLDALGGETANKQAA